jgi:hypothetical protein
MARHKPKLDGLVINLASVKQEAAPMARHKPKLDGLVIDLASVRKTRPRVYGFQPTRVKAIPDSAATELTVACQGPMRPRRTKRIRLGKPRQPLYEPSVAEIEAAKAEFRGRHRSEILQSR